MPLEITDFCGEIIYKFITGAVIHCIRLAQIDFILHFQNKNFQRLEVLVDVWVGPFSDFEISETSTRIFLLGDTSG